MNTLHDVTVLCNIIFMLKSNNIILNKCVFSVTGLILLRDKLSTDYPWLHQVLLRTIKEALYIRVNDPSLNRNVGKYHLPHVWDDVLFNTSELKLK